MSHLSMSPVVYGRVESIPVEGLQRVQTLVGAVGPPGSLPPRGPGQLGDDGSHGASLQSWEHGNDLRKCSP